MAKHKKYNPEKKSWKGRSYKKHGERISRLKDKARKESYLCNTCKVGFHDVCGGDDKCSCCQSSNDEPLF